MNQNQHVTPSLNVSESWLEGFERDIFGIADDLFGIANESAQITVRLSVKHLASKLSARSRDCNIVRLNPEQSFPVTNFCEPPPRKAKPRPRRRRPTTKARRRRSASA